MILKIGLLSVIPSERNRRIAQLLGVFFDFLESCRQVEAVFLILRETWMGLDIFGSLIHQCVTDGMIGRKNLDDMNGVDVTYKFEGMYEGLPFVPLESEPISG